MRNHPTSCRQNSTELEASGREYFIGIDPGAHGAVAVVDDLGQVVLLEDLPHGENGRVDAGELAAMLAGYAARSVALEQPLAFTPNAYSMMALGCSFGMCLAALQCIGVTPLTPVPRSWKAKLDLTSDKAESVARARALHADLPARLRHDKAEALLLAHYARGAGRPI